MYVLVYWAIVIGDVNLSIISMIPMKWGHIIQTFSTCDESVVIDLTPQLKPAVQFGVPYS